jgi:predicted RNase H-like HicB family nuclease
MAKTTATRGEGHRMTVSRSYAVVLEPSSAGGFVVTVPALPEVGTQGETVEEALNMARDAITLALSIRHEEGEEIPPDDAPVLERVRVQIEAA